MLHHEIEDNPSEISKLYGITQDPKTKNYMIVLHYAVHGSLRNYLDANYDKLSWNTKLFDLWQVASGLNKIHEKVEIYILVIY
jgi:serine/threonine protein kinase